MDDLNDLQFSPERQRSFFEAVARMQVPEDMKEEVRHFKPEGSMKRLQKVIELVRFSYFIYLFINSIFLSGAFDFHVY